MEAVSPTFSTPIMARNLSTKPLLNFAKRTRLTNARVHHIILRRKDRFIIVSSFTDLAGRES